jgi:hypothetical protein
MKHLIRYLLKPECVAENERLSAAVFEELRKVAPPGLRYAAFRLDDGVTCVHLVAHEIDGAPNELTALASFKAFSAGVKERCDKPPVRSELTEIGSYRMFDGA